MTSRSSFDPVKHLLALVAALAVALTLTPPRAAKADPGDAIAIGIIGAAIYCGATGKCTTTGRRSGGGGGGGPVDAVGLSGQTAMLVQGGLQNLGFYNGAIDGAIGAGTRNSIRSYQAAIGANQTGVLTATQINDLIALSPSYFSYPADHPQLFNADVANDLDRAGVRQLQAALNQQGYAAGSVDGAFGGMTRNAIAAYKAANGLPGQPVASRRLLARLMSWAPPEPAGKQIVNARNGITPAPVVVPAAPAPVSVPQAPAPAPAPLMPAAVPAGDQSFDILGVALGMSEAQVKGTLMAGLGGELMFDQAEAASFGAGGPVTDGFLTVQPSWPEAPSEQVMALFDAGRPELGAVAVFRMIRMPDTVDQATFEAQVLPDIVANYGAEGRVAGETRWIGKASAREAGFGAACGDPRLSVDTDVAHALDGLWRSGGGPRLDGGLGDITADCGEVLSVDYAGSVIRIGLWNSSALAGGAASGTSTTPKIKF
ncbi:MAG: peptidoglycan-binding protein [Maritimibacter sp.]|nr:peptidoglycan-binding protein [Maritimibacter sp.]